MISHSGAYTKLPLPTLQASFGRFAAVHHDPTVSHNAVLARNTLRSAGKRYKECAHEADLLQVFRVSAENSRNATNPKMVGVPELSRDFVAVLTLIAYFIRRA